MPADSSSAKGGSHEQLDWRDTRSMTLTSSAEPRFRVAIIGGGIAGLTLAVALGRYERPDAAAAAPLQIDMYEAGPEITTVGAGISVWPRTWAVMRDLGLYDALASEAVKSADAAGESELKPAFIFRKSDWGREGYEFGRVMVPDGATTMHRADMVDVLVRNLPASCTVHTSKRLLKYSEGVSGGGETHARTTTAPPAAPKFVLHFADGTKAEADVVVGADGIKSKTRAAMYEYAHARECGGRGAKEECERCSKATPKWTGTVAYRYLIPCERMREVAPRHRALEVKAPMSYCGKGKHIITYPISHGRFLNWIGFVTISGGEGTTYPEKWVTDARREDVVSHFSGWEPEVDEMLACVENPSLWAIHVVEDLPFSVYGKVALMGDAVHAMTTHFGAGGGQAIEDAYILGRLLADGRVGLGRVEEVLRIYEDVRLPYARGVVRNAGRVGLLYELNSIGAGDGVEEESKRELDGLGERIQEAWGWQWKEEVGDQWEEARRRVEMMVGGRKRENAGMGIRDWKCVMM